MARGPLAAAFHDWRLEPPHPGAPGVPHAELESAGTVAWRERVQLAYHWLDDRGNPIVWDGRRTALPIVYPGQRVTVEARVRAPIPPGRYRFALDLVVEHQAWFSELGTEAVT